MGRDISIEDTASAPAVVVVNEAFVRRFFPDAKPIGERFAGLAPAERTIVGVVNDAVYDSLRDEPKPTMYLPLTQSTMGGPSASAISLTIRAASGPPMRLVRSLRAAFAAASPELIVAFRPLADQVGASMLRERAMAILSGFFGALALLLAAVGLYGVTSYGVTRRQREFGIRLALGARGGDIIGLVLRRHLRLIAIGMSLGLAGAALLTRYLQGLLFGVTPLDPVTFVAVPLLLAVVAAVAALIPARRATRADPLVVLRAE
jgi:ABC-type antimicrobial peptide transport system permease subunit